MSWQPSIEKDFYLVRDMCNLTGLSKAAVYTGIQNLDLPGYKVGNRYVIPGPAFRAFGEGTWVSPKALLRLVPMEPRDRKPADLVVNIHELKHAV